MQARLLVLSASLKAESAEARLAAAAAVELSLVDADVTLISLTDYPMPLFGADALPRRPALAEKFAGMIRSHHGVFLATAEEHGAIPVLLANALAWAAASDPPPLSGRPVALGVAAPDLAAAARAEDILRRTLAAGHQALVAPNAVLIADRPGSFAEHGRLAEPRDQAAVQTAARALAHLARRLLPDI